MLNYIWGGLIIISLIFASVQDTVDLTENTYHNGEPQTVTIQFPLSGAQGGEQRVRFRTPGMDSLLTATWHATPKDTELVVPVTAALPAHWQTVAKNYSDENPDEMHTTVKGHIPGTDRYTVILPAVKFVKLRAITKAAFDMAGYAVKLAIGLIGIMALWLGLMRIAEKSGLILKLVKVVNPFLRFLFPDIPKDHPALGAISLNLAANVLGLGNAATPLGIKAMEELQKLNPRKDTATNAMCMFLTINTASVQFVPPVTLVAIMGIRTGELFTGIVIVTALSLIIGIITAMIFAKYYPAHPGLPETAEIGEEG